MIHSFILRFLADHDPTISNKKSIGTGIDGKTLLKVCYSLNMDCYSNNRFTRARKSLKNDIHNVEKTLRTCREDRTTDLNLRILESLKL